jgi:hypothetical protein
MSPKQKKIAAKAPPPDKIDAKDFAVLKAEKAKGRGMGLQDEKIKPGKVMKAKRGKMFDGYLSTFDASAEASTPKSQRGVTTIVGVKPGAEIGKGKKRFTSMEAMRTAKGFRTIDGKQETSSQFNKRRMELAVPKDIAKKALKATRIGKIALGIGAAGVAASQYLKSKMKKDEPKKKMVGGMAKKYSVGGGADMGRVGEYKSKLATALDRGRKIKKEGARITQKDLDFLKKQRPMSYKNGGPMMEPAAISKVKAYKDYKASKNRDQAKVKKMVGGMAKKYSVGGGMMNKPMGYSSGSKLMDFIKSGSYTDKYGTKTNVDKAIKKINLSPKDKDLATMKPASDKKMMGGGMMQRPMGGPMGGMMQRPMGYKSGTMVKARGCKLGRTRPTKMY